MKHIHTHAHKHIHTHQALKGEEKADYADFETVKMELVAKMAGWNPVLFGALPFQLCYAFAGGHIQFFCFENGGK